ncbi:MAG: DEAD/DEAH box helicase, partial [Lachnospiraceae bacterium]|nr:DEAD/DEAH box helicase [Lachnospiraceae bacterium]
MNTFDRYAPFIQDYIYQNGWENLRAVQAAAADVLFNTDENLLLTASTATGKTEAAFFPILTLFTEDMPSSVGAIYIGPLKALINDQFARLNDLCQEANIPVWHWHGDVSASHKNKMMKHPSGILQITPESLEAMLLHKHSAISRLFGDLRFIVIDELHSLMRGDRGGQTLCLIERLCRLANVNPRRIGLSATIGDPKDAADFLSTGTGRTTIVPKLPQGSVKWRLSMEHFYTFPPTNPGSPTKLNGQPVYDTAASKMIAPTDNVAAVTDDPLAPETAQLTSGDPAQANDTPIDDALAPKTDTAPRWADPGIGYIFEHTRGKKCLVFVNSREECEAVTTT